jgi:lipopolysaccharide export LptBFGC system permease protein LptF|tara:strand:+ start:1189 stop:1587 length:399 start_codon:yes stop_codon:yes gene_type:complete
MDILFYISGLITTLLVVLVIASLHAYTKYKTLIQYNEFVNSEAASTYTEMGVWKDNLDTLIRQIQNDMKNDGYENITNVKNTIEILNDEVQGIKTQTISFNKSVETSFANVYTQITDLKQRVSIPTQDIDRY